MTVVKYILLLTEILLLISKFLYYIFHDIYTLIRPIKKKSVANEIVLVRIKILIYTQFIKKNMYILCDLPKLCNFFLIFF